VDSSGAAVVAWTQGGARQAVTVPARGQLFHGGSLSHDVSRPTPKGGIANALVTLAYDGSNLNGRATFQGTPVTGTSSTLEGKRLRIYVYLDCTGCPGAGAGWKRMLGVAPKADGSFSALVKPEWKGKALPRARRRAEHRDDLRA